MTNNTPMRTNSATRAFPDRVVESATSKRLCGESSSGDAPVVDSKQENASKEASNRFATGQKQLRLQARENCGFFGEPYPNFPCICPKRIYSPAR